MAYTLVENEKSAAKSGGRNYSLVDEKPSQKSQVSNQNEPGYLDSLISDTKNFGKNASKGFIRGSYQLGHLLGQALDLGMDEGDKRFTSERLGEHLNRLNQDIPSEPGGFLSNTVENTLEAAPFAIAALPFAGAAGAAGLFGRAGLGGTAKAVAQEAGADETVQDIAQIAGSLSPDIYAFKNLVTNGRLVGKGAKQIIEEGRKLGLTDKQITPILNSDARKKALAKVAHKGASSKESLASTKQGLSTAYDNLASSELAKKPLEMGARQELIKDIQKELYKIPDIARKGIDKDIGDLISKKAIDGESLINLWQDVNAVAKSNPQKYGQLSQLKKPIGEALAKASPELYKDFTITNNLYSKYADISKSLKPGVVDKFVNAGEYVGALAATVTGNYPYLVKIGAEAGARRLATQMLTNPRFHQLGQKFANAASKNNWAAAQAISKQIAKDVHEYAPDISGDILAIDWDKIKAQDSE